MYRYLLPVCGLFALAACQPTEETSTRTTMPDRSAPATTESTPSRSAGSDASPKLAAVLAAQPEEIRERYRYRNPQATLEFFGIEPGMTVVEALPGAGWYTQILVDYLGPDGKLIGVDYEQSMFPLFGFFSDEFIESKKTWTGDFVAGAEQWRELDSAEVEAFVFGSMPEVYAGTADAVLMIRALHNVNRFENQGGYRTRALRDVYTALKPGGIVGVVQHQAPADKSAVWADGSRGYLHKDQVIEVMQAAGFEYVAESGINHNHRDQPGEEDIVWRLPPTLATSRENAELREQMTAIGESHRMTLKFRKP